MPKNDCLGCGRQNTSGFCEECQSHGLTTIPQPGLSAIAVTKQSTNMYPYSCECTTCPIHKKIGRKCGSKDSVRNGGWFCKNCMHQMSYNSYLKLYTDLTETLPVLQEEIKI
jgi:hypothetical protein